MGVSVRASERTNERMNERLRDLSLLCIWYIESTKNVGHQVDFGFYRKWKRSVFEHRLHDAIIQIYITNTLTLIHIRMIKSVACFFFFFDCLNIYFVHTITDGHGFRLLKPMHRVNASVRALSCMCVCVYLSNCKLCALCIVWTLRKIVQVCN